MGRGSRLASAWPRSNRGLLGALAIFLLAPAVYLPGLRPGWMPLSFDTIAFFHPLRQYLALAWHQGRWLPLWTSSVFMGVPFLANIQNAALYPPSLIYALMPVAPAMAWAMVLHTGIAGAGMYSYARRALRLHGAGSAVAAVIYMLGPYMTAHLTHLDANNTLAWTPWLMLAVDRMIVKPTRRLAVCIAVLVALAFLAGHTQQFYFSLLLAIIAGGTALLRLGHPTVRTVALRAGTVIAALAVGIALTGVQLVPTMELASFSIRGGGLDLASAGFLSLPLSGVMGSVLPKYSIELPTEFAGASVGAVALALMSLAVVSRWRRPVVGIWAGIFVLATWAATGPSGKLYDAFFYALPGLRLFRVPSRLLLFSTVAAAILAGYGVRTASQLAKACRRETWGSRTRTLLVLAAVLTSLPLVGALLDRLLGSHLPRPLKVLPHEIGTGDMVIILAFEALALLAIAAAAVSARRGGYRAVGTVLAGLTILDILLATASIASRHPLPASVLALRPPAASLLPSDPNTRYLSLYRPQVETYASLLLNVPGPDRIKYEEALRVALALRPDVGMNDGPLTPDGYDGGILPLRSYVDFRKAVLGASAVAPPDFTIHDLIDGVSDPQWLRDAGVDLLLTDAGIYPATADCQCFALVDTVGSVTAWRLSGTQPTRAWLEGPPGRRAATIVTDRGEEVDIALPDRLGGTLVLADTYYPGWSVTIDGRSGVIRPRDGFLREVTIPPGASQAVFRYEPASLRIGAALSLAGVVAMAVLLFILRPRTR